MSAGLAIVLLVSSALAADDQCEGCHGDPGFFAEYRKLYDYYRRWQGSPHQQGGVGCVDCHGGNPDSTEIAVAHAGVRPMNDTDSTLHSRAQPETCGQCHRANRNQFIRSRHYEALMRSEGAPTCTTCHSAMSSRPELRTIVVDACGNCHAPGNTANLPAVTDQARRVFQQLNVAGGLLGWTRIHFESHGWPADSRSRVSALETRYENILSEVHAFNLADTDAATTDFLGDLRTIFDAARRAYEEQAPEMPNP
ncbi:MAG: hypothetical protein OEW59_10750 [Gammaproteobacteria bacterium]|nr:hypothetical protein [Gammaproteobacteria bacterium]